MVTFGIIIATYASSISLNKEKAARNIQNNEETPDYFRLAIGMNHSQRFQTRSAIGVF